jgi:DNA-binding LytR/AlgR family response regulator
MAIDDRRRRTTNAWVLVVEDEPRLRDELVALLAALAPDLGQIRPVGTAEQALQLCGESMPHIAFVDIKLPGRSGLELVHDLPDDTRVVFVTAHDEFAVQAFDRGAVDYLLKPLTQERLQRCVDRLRNQITLPLQELRSILSALPATPPSTYLRWLTAITGRRTRLIPVQEIIYLQSDNKYTRIVSRDAENLIEESIKTLLPRLDPAEFLQVHRSTVVNLSEVFQVERNETGGGLLQLRSSKDVLRISAPFLREFKSFLD